MRFAARRIAEGERYPFLYGFAWMEWDRFVAVCYPIPFNVLARWIYRAYNFVRNPRDKVEESAAYAAGVNKGRKLASLESYTDGLQMYQEFVTALLLRQDDPEIRDHIYKAHDTVFKIHQARLNRIIESAQTAQVQFHDSPTPNGRANNAVDTAEWGRS